MSLLAGPDRFPSLEALLEAHATMPHRSRESLVPGLRHNSVRLMDGAWGWRYDRARSDVDPRPKIRLLWDAVEAVTGSLMLVRGERSVVVTDSSVDELRRRCAGARVEVVANAGYAVQSDAPLALARVVDDFLS